MRTLFLSILLVNASLFVGCKKEEVQPNLPVEKIDYSFLVAGHVYGDPQVSVLGFYPPFKEHFSSIQEQEKIEFAFFTGDVVREASNETQWDSAITDMNTLGLPYHVAAGNHDRGSVFLERFGEYYYSFQYGQDLFVILNTFQWNIEGEQKEFLENTLSDLDGIANVFLFSHELIWWSPDSIFQNIGINWIGHYPGSTNYWSEISPILESAAIPVYLFSGDVGATWASSPYAYYSYENIHFIASGMGYDIDSNYLIVNVYENNKVKLNLKAIEGDPDRLGDISLYELP